MAELLFTRGAIVFTRGPFQTPGECWCTTAPPLPDPPVPQAWVDLGTIGPAGSPGIARWLELAIGLSPLDLGGTTPAVEMAGLHLGLGGTVPTA